MPSLIERLKNILRLAGGIGFIVFGIAFAVIRNVEFAENDVRASDGYRFGVAAVEIAIGIWLLLSLRDPKLRGPWRRRDE
jgi:hypothetical protein